MKSANVPTREKILDTAYRLFHKQGYNSTGINQIIEEAGVAKASLYQIFKSKEELCIEYLNTRHDIWFKKLNDFIVKGKSAKAKTVEAFNFIYNMNVEEDFRGCSFLNILSEIPVANVSILSVIQSHKQDLRSFFKTILVNENQDMIDHVYLLFESTIIESQLFRDQWPVERSIKIINSFLQ